MRRLLKFTLPLVALCLIALPAFAQGGTTIGLGDTVTGSLTDAAPSATYTLQAEAGQVVTVTLTSEDFDSYLSILDSTGTAIAENDDSIGTNSGIQAFVLPAGTSYQILVESYSQHNNSGAETGAYTLSVVEQQIAHIEYTQSVSDSLTDTVMSQDYVFTGQEGDAVVINLNSDDFDSYLRLLDSSGNEIASNDDSGNSLNSQIGPYVLPATGSYTIRASSLGGSSAGAYTLTLGKVDVTAISYDEAVEVAITKSGESRFFTFTGAAGDLITVSAVSNGSIDTSLILSDPYNSQVASDDDSGSGPDPEIYQQLLNQDGTYTLELRTVAGSNGKLTLTVKRTLPPSLDEGAQSVFFNDSGATRAVAFAATAGQTVKLTFTVDGTDPGSPNVSVLQGGNTLAYASGSTTRELSFSFVTPTAGDVIVQINDYSYTNLSYIVTLERMGTE